VIRAEGPSPGGPGNILLDPPDGVRRARGNFERKNMAGMALTLKEAFFKSAIFQNGGQRASFKLKLTLKSAI